MTALSIERLVHPRRPAAARTARVVRAHRGLFGDAVRAGRAFDIDSTVSPADRARTLRRFAGRTEH